MKASAGEKIVLDSVNPRIETEQIERLGPKVEDEEKRKKRKDEEKDIFVHFSAVQDAGLKHLREGEQLTFEVENSDKGPRAINLQKTS